MTDSDFTKLVKELQAVYAERFLDGNKRTLFKFTEVIRKCGITSLEYRDMAVTAFLSISLQKVYTPDETDALASMMAFSIRGFKMPQNETL